MKHLKRYASAKNIWSWMRVTSRVFAAISKRSIGSRDRRRSARPSVMTQPRQRRPRQASGPRKSFAMLTTVKSPGHLLRASARRLGRLLIGLVERRDWCRFVKERNQREAIHWERLRGRKYLRGALSQGSKQRVLFDSSQIRMRMVSYGGAEPQSESFHAPNPTQRHGCHRLVCRGWLFAT